MNATKTKDGFEICKDLRFLGRSGVIDVKGLRLAYISGLDSDLLGEGIYNDPSGRYKSNYFDKSDIENVLNDYEKIFTDSGKPGVDILICG